MRLCHVYLCIVLLISTASASPVPYDYPADDTQSQSIKQEISPGNVESKPLSSLGTTFANLAMAGTGTALLIGSGVGIAEWALNWYARFLRDRNTRTQQNQTLHDDCIHRQEQRTRRERAMDLILEMAENHSEKVGSVEDFDGNFEALVVPSSIVGAVENVFEQTSDVEGIEDDKMESLEGLKDALKPILEFNKEVVTKRKEDLG
jgi:hypothetical protein